MESRVKLEGMPPNGKDSMSGHLCKYNDFRDVREFIKLGNLVRLLLLERNMDVRFGVCSPTSGKDLNPVQSLISKDSSDARPPRNSPLKSNDERLEQYHIQRILSLGNKFKFKVVSDLQLFPMNKC